MRKKVLIFVSVLGLASGGFAAKKPKPAPVAVATVKQMTPDEKVLHALSRLSFGPRPGDVEAVSKVGVSAWIDQQLHPESIAENPDLTARLALLSTLKMSTAEMMDRYPSQQEVKAIAEGVRPMPSDPEARVRVEIAVQRYKARQANADGGAPVPPMLPGVALIGDPDPAMAPMKPPPPGPGRGGRGAALGQLNMLTAEQRRSLLDGTQDDRLFTLHELSDRTFAQVMEVLPPAMRNRLTAGAPADLQRRMLDLTAGQQLVNRDLMEGKLLRAVQSNRQLEEVLADFWYNHFNVFIDKGADRYMVTSYERDVIRPHVLGKFKDLLMATAQSPAMLFYLDNWQSTGPAPQGRGPGRGRGAVAPPQRRAQGLNENYGRELMELHTLGVDGGYTQQDVTEVARCFTGWTIQQPQRVSEFQFNPRMHDNGEKHVLGVTIPAGGGMDDGKKVIEILAHHPSTARFISNSLAMRFVSDNPPEEMVAAMAKTFLDSDGDLREVMRTMLQSPQFWESANFRSKVKSPLEFVVSSIRALNGQMVNVNSLTQLLTQLGQPLYRKVEPTGYSNRGLDWLNSASLLARMNFANAVAQGKNNGVTVDTSQFIGTPQEIERALLFTAPSTEAQAAIQAGLEQQGKTMQTGSLVAGMTLGSPDFQRR